MISSTVPELSSPSGAGAIASDTDVAVSPGFSVGGHLSEVEALVVSLGHRFLSLGFEFHHQTVYVCYSFRVIPLLLREIIRQV